MARFRFVGRNGARRRKVATELCSAPNNTYNDLAVDEADPNVQFVKKLQKRLKLFRDIAGDSDGVGKLVYVLYTFRALRLGPSAPTNRRLSQNGNGLFPPSKKCHAEQMCVAALFSCID